jgi:hypothetical protein
MSFGDTPPGTSLNLIEIPGPVLIGIRVGYRDNHKLFERYMSTFSTKPSSMLSGRTLPDAEPRAITFLIQIRKRLCWMVTFAIKKRLTTAPYYMNM